MEGTRVIDWGAEIAGKYGLEVNSVRKGRGSWIFETDQGLKLLKEYKGSVKRLEFEEAVLDTMKDAGALRVDQYVRNLEQELISTAEDGTRYLVKNWFSDRECDLKDRQEILSAVRQIAVLHQSLRQVENREEWNLKSMISPPLYEAMEKHNRELRKARTFIRGKRKKNEFELTVIATYDRFYEQAIEASQGMRNVFEQAGEEIVKNCFVCHGELNQHHILIGDEYVAVTEFNKMHLGLQVEDLYYFTRKIMEKHDWDKALGNAMLEAYERVLPMTQTERECLYNLFLYPEKYWKQMNFYYNANKAWGPARQTEKIYNLERQQEARMEFVTMIKW
ncbi:MAG: spore coat protein CotS [Lachnospiraceae bacterium]|nr:spore coat protein CotS [Lachnospiraceae bacterium]